MSLLNKSNLNFKYTWSTVPGDNPKVTGFPDSTRFSRREGYEVLYLINILCSEWRVTKIESALKMEKMINEKLPSNIQSQEAVKNWIYMNWKM